MNFFPNLFFCFASSFPGLKSLVHEMPKDILVDILLKFFKLVNLLFNCLRGVLTIEIA